MRDALGLFQSPLALAEGAKHEQTGQGVLQPSADLLEEPLFPRRPGARVRALMQAQHVGPVPFGMDGHGNHGLDAETLLRT